MAKTLHFENLDVGASEKTIQFLLNYSTSTISIQLSEDLEGLEEIFKN